VAAAPVVPPPRRPRLPIRQPVVPAYPATTGATSDLSAVPEESAARPWAALPATSVNGKQQKCRTNGRCGFQLQSDPNDALRTVAMPARVIKRMPVFENPDMGIVSGDKVDFQALAREAGGGFDLEATFS